MAHALSVRPDFIPLKLSPCKPLSVRCAEEACAFLWRALQLHGMEASRQVVLCRFQAVSSLHFGCRKTHRDGAHAHAAGRTLQTSGEHHVGIVEEH